MAASVIVTSYNSLDTLRKCLKALSLQECGQIVVADSSGEDPAPTLQGEFPLIEFQRFPVGTAVPVMRWAALKRCRYDIVLAVEARCVPEPGWAKALEDAHFRYPEVPAIGGSVSAGGSPSPFDWGLFFCEYGRFAPPLPTAEASDLSGANLSYKKRMLERESDLLSTGAWETLFHLRWRTQGLRLMTVPAQVAFQNSMRPLVALQQRFHYGRGYAGSRARRWAYLPIAPLLPFVLTWRIFGAAARGDYASHVPAAALWVIGLTMAWSCGELVGYVAGPGRASKNF